MTSHSARGARFQRAFANRGLSAALLLAGLPVGCAQWGADVLRDNHVAFNTSVAQAMDRQMLLNIVRLSMDEPTQWMTVSAINVNTSVGVAPNGLATIPSSGIVSGQAGGAANFNYTPNITFVPRQGEQLANELMSPIPVSSLEHMVSASWPISWVVFLTCERLQEIDSFDVTSGFGVRAADRRFARLMQLFDELQRRQSISFSQVPMPFTWNRQPIPATEFTLGRVIDGKRERAALMPRPDGSFDFVTIEPAPVLTVYEGAARLPEASEMLQLLQLGDKPGNFRVVGLETQLPGDYLTVRTRSLAALLRLLSFGVDHARNAPPPPTNVDTPGELWELMLQNAGDKAVDLAPYVNAVFRVQRGASAPSDAAVSVFYRGDWYWIDTRDITARRVFALVRDLFDLQVKAGSETQPVLTVPVGR
jgi:hypothetical protein